MGYYKIIRQKPQGKAIYGTLYQVEHRYSGSAGENKEYLTVVAHTLENDDHLIPALVYKVQVTQSPRFKRLLPCLLQVPSRTGIRFHRGTKPEHSKGCILVSAADEQKITALWLAEQQGHEETLIEFV